MPTYTLTGRVTPEHALDVQLPADVPAGEARVVVTVEPVSVESQMKGSATALLAWLREREKRPPSGRTAKKSTNTFVRHGIPGIECPRLHRFVHLHLLHGAPDTVVPTGLGCSP